MENLDVHRRKVFSLSERIKRVVIEWIHLAHDRGKRAVFKVAINLRLP